MWRRHAAPAADRLAPGLSAADIEALAAPRGLHVPPEAQTLRNWLALLQDGVGSMLVVDAAPDGGQPEASAVHYRSKDDGASAEIIAPSVGALVRMWLAVFDAAVDSYDHDQDRWALALDELPADFDERLL